MRWWWAFAFSACLAPTEIALDITTNVDCAKVSGTRIDIGQTGVDASVADLEAQQCSGGEIGSLVILPGGASSPIVTIEVAAAVGTTLDICRPPYTIDAGAGVGCIVARRALRFASHLPLHLPIALDSDCLNIPCGADETCVHAACVPSTIDPSSCDGDAGCQLVDAGVDAGSSATPIQIAVGNAHACALMSDGTIRCWGDNTSGQLGTAKGGNFSPTPVQVDTINDARTISANNATTCVVRTSGDVWCWGDDSYGSVDAVARDGGAPHVPTPTFSGKGAASVVSVGATFTCASLTVDAGLTTVCWGERPSSTGNTTPDFADIGYQFGATLLSCGQSACVESDGNTTGVFGENINDQLDVVTNDGTITAITTNLIVPATGVAMGTSFGCAFGGTSGGVVCWGDNAFGELGTPPGAPLLATPVPGLKNVTSLAAGGMHACAVSGGIVSCWGDNGQGQLGTNDVTMHTPQPLSLTGVSEVATSLNGTCVRQGVTVTCWGSANVLGDGTTGTSARLAPGAPVKL